MKSFYFSRILLFLFTASFALVSCSDDDDGGESNGTGNVTYDGANFNLSQGFITDYGEEDGLYNYDITLLSDDFNVDFADEEVVGTGEILYFELWTDQSSGLKNGTYVMSDTEIDLGMTYAEFALNYNFDADDDGFLEATDGEITVNRSGNTYTLDFDLTFENGKSLNGRYVGTLFEIN